MSQPDWKAIIADADSLLHSLFPLCRSITGNDLRRTLALLGEVIPFTTHEVPSGTTCYDWTVPDEWNVRDAWVADASGKRIIDFRQNNVHLVNYSVPFKGHLTYQELLPHLHTLPDLPKAIPYRTTYYKRTWGFCLAYEQLQTMDPAATYHVMVDATLTPGSLTYGEALLPGDSGEEFLISTYVCHPSLANDNLSGVVLWTYLLRELQRHPHRHSYRFVIAPETIGALAYISRHETAIRALSGGFVITTVAGPGGFGYKASYCGNARVDRAARLTFRELDLEFTEYPFDVNGSDERQYSTPGLRVPVGTICKDKYYEYPYYHTSLDDLEFISATNLVETLKLYWMAIEKLEQDRTYRSLNPIGEPMLGKRGLYPQTGGAIKQQVAGQVGHDERCYAVDAGRIIYGNELDAIRWVLFHADGQTSLMEIAERTGLPLGQLHDIAEKLASGGLLQA